MPTKRLARSVHSRGDGLSSPWGGVVALLDLITRVRCWNPWYSLEVTTIVEMRITVIRSFRMKKDISFPPVQLGDLTTNDRNLTGGSTQSYVISLWQCEKEGSEHCTPIDLAVQDGSMNFLRIIYFR